MVVPLQYRSGPAHYDLFRTPLSAFTLDTPLADFPDLPPRLLRSLARAEMAVARDLITHFPRRYEDRTRFDRFPGEESDTAVCVRGEITRTSLKRFGGWKRIFEVTLEEPGGGLLSHPLVCRWFNSPWVQKALASGQEVVVYGKPKRRGNVIGIDHPEFEVVETGEEISIHLDRIVPVHRAVEGASPRVLRAAIYRILEMLDLFALDAPAPGLNARDFAEALRAIHFPASMEALDKARRRLVFAEFFALQLVLAARRGEQRALRRVPHSGPGELVRRFHASLPFALTGAQVRTIGEIEGDLRQPFPMNRLLHGDVGSGKTLVALSAMLRAVEAGCQAALMAPTQILAEQHYLTCQRLLAPLGVRVALRTAARREDTSLPLFDHAGNDEAQIMIGTHALLYEGAEFSRLGLAVIDEQHKFGVMQRARLMEKGDRPDILVMTATPIPRTLTMTLYGDLDVSTLDELPARRGRIVTAVRDEKKLPDAAKFIREQLEADRQAYIVYPLIDESESLTAKAATAEIAKWQKWLAPFSCKLLHGRIAPEEKDAIMGRFRAGEIHALIATTVIEVGIDVPNANIMLIENAERFGLAQLHQLRGRIGRGEHKSWCILIHGKDADLSDGKLATLEATADGFQIAEADLRLRGPGDLLGTAQSGLPPLKLGDPMADGELMQEARRAARALIEADPKLSQPENQHFRPLLVPNRETIFAQVS